MASRVGSVQVIMEPRYFMFSLVGMGVLSMMEEWSALRTHVLRLGEIKIPIQSTQCGLRLHIVQIFLPEQ